MSCSLSHTLIPDIGWIPRKDRVVWFPSWTHESDGERAMPIAAPPRLIGRGHMEGHSAKDMPFATYETTEQSNIAAQIQP